LSLKSELSSDEPDGRKHRCAYSLFDTAILPKKVQEIIKRVSFRNVAGASPIMTRNFKKS